MTSAQSTTGTFRDSALVLRAQDLGEHDRIVIMATLKRGLVHAVAKGVRKSSSKLGARLEPLMLVEIEARRSKKLATITQAVTQRAYMAPIAGDYTRFTVATVVTEVAEQVLQNETEAIRQHFDLLAGALSALARGTVPPHRVLDSYLLRSLHLAGWSMAITRCGSCSRDNSLAYYSPQVGVVCSQCAHTNQFSPLAPVSPAASDYLAALASGRWEQLPTDAPLMFRQSITEHIMDYVQWQLERPLKTRSTLEKEI